MSNTLPKELSHELYRRMRRIRRFEERVVEFVDSNEIAGICHEYIGQEAVAVGACAALRIDDVITSTHRGHGHIIAKGGETDKMLAELFGRATGYNKARGGSMHIVDFGLGIYGANGIVGAGAPMACGAAFAAKREGIDRVAMPFFGDGAINQGVLHESLNLAAIWHLPVVFVCENNMYAISTPLREVTKLPPHERAKAYGMPSVLVDGMDVQAVYDAASAAVQRAREGGGPTFIEAETYRYSGHYTAEKQMKTTYRSQEEILLWQKRDAVNAWGRRMVEVGLATEAEVAALDKEIDDELIASADFARNSPLPNPEDALNFVYNTTYPGLPAWGYEA